jgi:hypothetical protein
MAGPPVPWGYTIPHIALEKQVSPAKQQDTKPVSVLFEQGIEFDAEPVES